MVNESACGLIGSPMSRSEALEYKLLIEENKNSPNNAAEARAK